MRWNLDINFGQIGDISSSASEYASSMKDLKSALDKFVSVVKDNEGQAAQALQEKPEELNGALDKNAAGLELISNLLKEFDSTMTGIIAPVSRGSNMKINTLEVKNRLKDLNKKLDSLEGTCRTVSVPKLGTLPPVETSTDPDKSATPSVDRDLYYQVKAQLERMEDVLDSVKSNTSALFSTYSQQIENMRKEVEDFENTDDDFENKAENAWEDYQDLSWYQTTTGKIVLGVVAVAACVAIAVVGVPAIAIGLATLGVSATASMAIATGAVVLAKGAIVGAIANTTVDVALAAYNKQDIDSAAGTGLINGVVSGAVSAGIGAALPGVIAKGGAYAKQGISAISKMAPGMTAKVTQVGSKIMSAGYKYAPGMTIQITQFGQNVIKNSDKITKSVTKIVSDVAEDAAEAAVDENKTFDLRNSTLKSTTGEIVGVNTKSFVKKVEDKIDELKIVKNVKDKAKTVVKSVGGVVGDEAKGLVNDIRISIEESLEGEGGIVENFDHKSNITNPQKLIKSALKPNKKDAESLAKTGTDKVLDFIEKSIKNRYKSAH